jgi:hypothetical protein
MTQLFVDTLANEAGTGPTTLTKQSAAKAWANASGDGTTLNESFNVSSLDDVSAGRIGINLTNNMSTGTHAAVGTNDTNPGGCYGITVSGYSQFSNDYDKNQEDPASVHTSTTHGTLA